MGNNGACTNNSGKAGATGDGNGERLAQSKLILIASHERNRRTQSHDFGMVAKAAARNAWGSNSTKVNLLERAAAGLSWYQNIARSRLQRRRFFERGRGGGRALEQSHRHQQRALSTRAGLKTAA